MKILMSMVLLIVAFAACKKEKANPDDPNNPDAELAVSREDLIPYYIVAERKAGDNKLAVFYFSKEGNVVKVNLHRQGYLRSGEVNMDKSGFTFDLEGNGNFVYTFVFEKSAEGKVSLKSYSFTDKANAAQGFEYAVLGTQGSIPSFENGSFKSGDILFQFSAARNIEWDIKSRQIGTKYYPPPINKVLPVMAEAPEVSVPYYGISPAGFKANNDFIGALVPSWKDTATPLLLVERNSIIYLSVKQP